MDFRRNFWDICKMLRDQKLGILHRSHKHFPIYKDFGIFCWCKLDHFDNLNLLCILDNNQFEDLPKNWEDMNKQHDFPELDNVYSVRMNLNDMDFLVVLYPLLEHIATLGYHKARFYMNKQGDDL